MPGVFSATPVPVGTTAPFDDQPSDSSSDNNKNPVLPGFIRVRNHAASFNPVDKFIAAGYFAARAPVFDFEKMGGRSVGSDFAGEVIAVGEGATITALDGSRRPAEVGDKVFGDGIVGTGSFTEYVTLLAEQAVVKPDGLSFAEAAALPLAALTALQAFTKHAPTPVGPGSKVLVLGGTGGVGSIAVQIAKALGAHVAATGSDTELLASLGVDNPINYREQDWGQELAGQDFDLIFATVNDDKPAPAAERALKVLGAEGTFLCLLESILPKPELDLGGRKFSFFLTDSKDYASLVRIAALASEGKIKPVFSQGRTFPFTKDAWAELMAEANSGRAKGKLVMSIIDEQ